MRGLALRLRQSTACLMVLWALAPAPADAQSYQSTSRPAINQLTIAAWIVQIPSNDGTSQSGTAQTSTWRNTFGRERKTARWRKLGRRSIDADIVVLKRLKSLADVRRLFPARTHQVITSRAALANANRSTALIAGEKVKPSPFAYESFPAIAIRRRRGMRVTAIRHITTQIEGTGVGQTDSPPRHIALAARINVTGRFVWVMTPIVDVTCKTNDRIQSDCPTGKPPIDQIHRWLRKFTNQRTPIIIATTTERSARRLSDEGKAEQEPAKDVNQTAVETPECESGQRPIIVAADRLPTDVVEMSQLKSSPDRPCATIAQLNYKN